MRTLNWMLLVALATAFVGPVRADEQKPGGTGTSEEPEATDESLSESAKEAKTPIKRLVEMKLDQNVIPARQLDLGLAGRTKTLQDILDKFEEYGEDDEIGAVLLNVSGFAMSTPNIEALRDGITRFRENGKKVYSYLHDGGPSEFLLACATDEIAIAPVGGVVIPGIARQFPFFKGNLELRGLEAQVITAGRYKYPGFDTSRKPNEFFTEEITQIIDGWFGDYKRMIAEGRHLSDEKVSELIDTAMFRADEARNVGLVDVLAYYDDYRDRIATRERFKKSKDESDMSEVMSLQDLIEKVNEQMRKQREQFEDVGPKIAVLHARGPIIDMSLSPILASSIIQRDDFIEVVEQLRKNKSVKAVVMAVDSPGGSPATRRR
jgi:protease-4